MTEPRISKTSTLSEWVKVLDKDSALGDLSDPVVKEKLAVLADVRTLFPPEAGKGSAGAAGRTTAHFVRSRSTRLHANG